MTISFPPLEPIRRNPDGWAFANTLFAMVTPYTKAYWFSEISALPLRNIPWLPTQQIVLWGTQWVSEKLREFLFHIFLLQRQRFQQENHSAFKESIQILSCVSLKHFAGCGFYSGLMFRALRFSPWLSRSWVPVPFPLFAQQRWCGDIGTEVLCQKI